MTYGERGETSSEQLVVVQAVNEPCPPRARGGQARIFRESLAWCSPSAGSFHDGHRCDVRCPGPVSRRPPTRSGRVLSLGAGVAVLLSPKGTHTHRVIGTVYVLALVLVNVAALSLHRENTFGVFHALAVVSLPIAAGLSALLVVTSRRRVRPLRHEHAEALTPASPSVNLNQRFQDLEVFGGHSTVSVKDGSVVFAAGAFVRNPARRRARDRDARRRPGRRRGRRGTRPGGARQPPRARGGDRRQAFVFGPRGSDMPAIPARLGLQAPTCSTTAFAFAGQQSSTPTVRACAALASSIDETTGATHGSLG